ncbi:FAD-dependent oxidoreductase [Devosia sp.]|uniref:FAD-dependent oxidoreductase n=1 Tax=Devosia sp. TaxID=1871048 RepID=UPI001ACE1C4D|nr:FAD-dependent oxidoreductase [Devosia sp.]MBN9336082.1 FAD-dependent monooxygenase [Devosia sp.]
MGNHNRHQLRSTTSPRRSAVVVGGSLAGLMTALSLARTGIKVTVLERSRPTGRTGAALRVGSDQLSRLVDTHTTGHALTPGLHAWTTVHAALSAAATATEIEFHHHTEIVEIEQDHDTARAIASDGCSHGFNRPGSKGAN